MAVMSASEKVTTLNRNHLMMIVIATLVCAIIGIWIKQSLSDRFRLANEELHERSNMAVQQISQLSGALFKEVDRVITDLSFNMPTGVPGLLVNSGTASSIVGQIRLVNASDIDGIDPAMARSGPVTFLKTSDKGQLLAVSRPWLNQFVEVTLSAEVMAQVLASWAGKPGDGLNLSLEFRPVNSSVNALDGDYVYSIPIRGTSLVIDASLNQSDIIWDWLGTTAFWAGMVFALFVTACNFTFYMGRRQMAREMDGGKISLREIHLLEQLERVMAERDNALHSAREAEETRDEFLSSTNHYLRQPLQAIRSALDACENSQMDPKKVTCCMRLINAAMSGLEEVCLRLAEVYDFDTGRNQPKPQVVELRQVMSDVAFNVASTAKKSPRIKVAPCASFARVDPGLLREILTQLLQNAISHSQASTILLGCRHTKDGIRVEVWDNGKGIPQDQLGRVFNDYVQLNNPERSRHNGLGLGLGMVRRMAELMGCTFGVQSKQGKGTRFWITIPLAAPEQKRRAA